MYMLSLLIEYFRLCLVYPGESFFLPRADFFPLSDIMMLVSQWRPATYSTRVFDCQRITNTVYLMGQATNSIVCLINRALMVNFFLHWSCRLMFANCGTGRLTCNQRLTLSSTIETKIPRDLSEPNQVTRKQKSVVFSTCEAEVAATTKTAQSVNFIRNALNSGG